MQAGFDGGKADALDAGNVSQRQFMHIDEGQRAAISHGQLAQSGLQQRMLLRAFQGLRRAGLVASLLGYFRVLYFALRW